jgi:hypothetical protein
MIQDQAQDHVCMHQSFFDATSYFNQRDESSELGERFEITVSLALLSAQEDANIGPKMSPRASSQSGNVCQVAIAGCADIRLLPRTYFFDPRLYLAAHLNISRI